MSTKQTIRTSADGTPEIAAQEDGYILIGVLFLVVVLLIGLALAAPKIATTIRRDKETELYHRGMQYTRAIKLYYKKFGRYPISVDQLESSNNLRFLRKRYKDPFTGKADWRMIHVGEAKVAQTGLFGQPLGVAGAGNSGSNGQTGSGSNGFGNSGSFGQSSNGAGGSSAFGNSFGSGSGNGSSFGNSFGSNSSQSSVGNSSGNPGSSTDPTSGSGSNGSGTGTSGSGFGSSNTGGTTGLGNSSLTSSSGSPIGSAGPIIGIASSIDKESIREFRNQKHYNQWEFVYNPQTDLGGMGGNTGMGVVGQGGNTNNSFGSSFGNNSGSNFGNNNGSSFGNSFGSGSNSNNSNTNGNSNNNGSGSGSPPANPNPSPAPPVQMDPPSP